MNLSIATRQLLRHYKIFPKKRFGQNFMTDEAILHAMASHAALRRDDVVLEIGAGLGGLTRIISPFCKTVVAVEADRRFIDVLRKELTDLLNITLVEGDVLKATIPKFNKVVSNPPFHISSPILFWLLNQNFELAVLTFQKEFARRLTGSVGSKDYSRLTVETYYRAEVELLENVPKEAFFPPPKVDANIVRLKPWKTQPFRLKNEKAFHELVRALFTQRNRKVRNAVQSYLREKGKKRELADSLLFHDKRVRELAPEDFGALADELVS